MQYKDVPPQVFISKLNKFVRENQPPGSYSATIAWDRVVTAEEQEVEDLQHSMFVGLPLLATNFISPVNSFIGAPRELPNGYRKIEDAPVLRGANYCVYCLCSPCIVTKPPIFLRGACDPHPANAEKRYMLYRKFWRCLNAIGVWQNEEYLTRKELRTTRGDKRDIMPDCVIKVGTF